MCHSLDHLKSSPPLDDLLTTPLKSQKLQEPHSSLPPPGRKIPIEFEERIGCLLFLGVIFFWGEFTHTGLNATAGLFSIITKKKQRGYQKSMMMFWAVRNFFRPSQRPFQHPFCSRRRFDARRLAMEPGLPGKQ